MKTLIICIMLCSTAASAQTSRSFWDNRGSFAGSSNNNGNQTSFSDRNGHFSGNAIHNSNGTTSFYDRNGHFTGSSTDTSPRR
jgi:hypothetical protein